MARKRAGQRARYPPKLSAHAGRKPAGDSGQGTSTAGQALQRYAGAARQERRPLLRVVEYDRVADLAEQLLRESVAAARAEGASWAVVAEALGVSRQSAWRRFGTSEGAGSVAGL